MKTTKKVLLSVLFLVSTVTVAQAQFVAMGYVEYGYSVLKFKSEELGVFLNSYNNYQPGLTQPFGLKIGAARGDYFKFGVGVGGENTKMIMDFTIYKVKTNALEARFADGSGRDIWAEQRSSLFNIGVRFGGSREVPVWIQLDMLMGIQVSSIYSAYVYPDGSRSLGIEKDLNGVYSSFVFSGGGGITAGCRIIGPLGVSVSLNYLGNGSMRRPDYHQYWDGNDVKENQPDYLPRDMAMYVSDPNNSIENSISNDFRGWKFTAGLTMSIGDWGK